MYDQRRVLAIARQATTTREYVVYTDFNDYMRELISQGTLLPTRVAFSEYEIKRILLDNGYRYQRHREARFYPLTEGDRGGSV